MSSEPTYLGIDFGTSAVRACLINQEQQCLAISRYPLTTSSSPLANNPAFTHRTQAPEEWLQALKSCLAQLFEDHAADQVQSIAVDGTSATVLMCEPDSGEPLSPALMYDDASSINQLAELRKKHPQPEVALSITAGLPKALQLAAHMKRGALIQHQADWITGWLVGHYGFSDENNALKTGYDPVSRQWPDWVCQVLPEHVQLPRVQVPGTELGTAGNELQALGISADTRILAGTTDSTAAFLATGVDRHDQGVTTLGSTLVIKQLSRNLIQEPDNGIYSHRLGDTWLTGGASNSGCRVLDRFFTSPQLVRLSQSIDPETASGLNYYPLTAQGERFPENNPDKLPVLEPRPGDDSEFLKGLFEGIANIEKQGYEKLRQLGTLPVSKVMTAGGGSDNVVWQVIRSRILGVPAMHADETEAAYGAARLAKHGLKLWNTFT